MPLPPEHTSLHAVIPAPRLPGRTSRSRPRRVGDGVLAAAVDSARRTLRDRPGPLPAALLDVMTDRLRWAAGVDPAGTPARACVHVACAQLASGDLEEGFLALEQAAGLLPGGSGPDAGTGGGASGV